MGLRIGELCTLKKESFDLDNYTITVSHTILRIKNVNKSRNYKTKLIITNPKSKTSLRTIPIPDLLKKYGEEHIKTGYPIIYTSADSVFQIAAHEDVIPVNKLYEICKYNVCYCCSSSRFGWRETGWCPFNYI